MLILCPYCNLHRKVSDTSCPHCTPSTLHSTRLSSILLLGLGLAACGEKSSDTADTASSDTASTPIEPADAPEYGVEAVGNADVDLFLDFEEIDSENTNQTPSE